MSSKQIASELLKIAKQLTASSWKVVEKKYSSQPGELMLYAAAAAKMDKITEKTIGWENKDAAKAIGSEMDAVIDGLRRAKIDVKSSRFSWNRGDTGLVPSGVKEMSASRYCAVGVTRSAQVAARVAEVAEQLGWRKV